MKIPAIRKGAVITLSLLLAAFTFYYCYPGQELPEQVRIDHILVVKSKRLMYVYSEGELVKTYKISLGRRPTGKKEFEGDTRTPEGVYRIHDKNPDSGYHRNLGISYPNREDTEHASRIGKPPGGAIKIHGLRNRLGFFGKFHRLFDWTAGCIAVTNKEIDELYRSVDIGTTIEIQP